MTRVVRLPASNTPIEFVVGSYPGGQSALQLLSVAVYEKATNRPASRTSPYEALEVKLSSNAVASLLRLPVVRRHANSDLSTPLPVWYTRTLLFWASVLEPGFPHLAAAAAPWTDTDTPSLNVLVGLAPWAGGTYCSFSEVEPPPLAW